MKKIFIAILLTAAVMAGQAQDGSPDPNFYIYLCFGQSNMEGQAKPEDVDQNVDERFQVLAALDFSNPKRTMGEWYTATPPIVRQWAGLGMADYFGRTMVAALPSHVKVGVVDVAVGGIAIEGFMPDKIDAYLQTSEQWLRDLVSAYGNNPYQRLVDMGRIAQKAGVIKGILLHQGESNNGQQAWLQSVKQVYESLLADLNLNAEDVPLFAGETVNADVGGTCSLHNTIIAQLPNVIPTAHVVRSNGCPCASDNIHFTAAGYRTMGKRYAYEALKLMGQPTQAQADYSWNEDLKNVYALKQLDPVDDITLRVGGSKVLKVWGTFADGHRENLVNEVQFSSEDFTIQNGMVVGSEAKKGTVTASYTDFIGQTHTLTINVEVAEHGPNHVLVVGNGSVGANQWDKEALCKLAIPMEVGKDYIIRATMRADQNGDCAVWPRWDASTNRDQWGNSADIQYLATQNVTTNFQELSWRCRANFTHDVLIFAIGKLGGSVYFDDVSCMEDGGTVEMIANGNFESDDISNWSVLSWTGQTLSIAEDETTGVRQVEREGTNHAIYDLSGRRVKNPTKGAYIVNGKVILF
jgi:hypothetical protein